MTTPTILSAEIEGKTYEYQLRASGIEWPIYAVDNTDGEPVRLLQERPDGQCRFIRHDHEGEWLADLAEALQALEEHNAQAAR